MSSTSSLPDEFERIARRVLACESAVVYRWDLITPTNRRLVFPKQHERGFEVRAEAKEYGLYAFADGWHSSAWDANTPGWSLEEMATDFLGFLRTLLSTDATLEVHLAGGHPHKWVLHYIDENGPHSETTGLFLFRYWGAREIVSRQNTALPPRYELP
jgi:hypothetical protein